MSKLLSTNMTPLRVIRVSERKTCSQMNAASLKGCVGENSDSQEQR